MAWVSSLRRARLIAALATVLALGFSPRAIAGAADVCELQLEVFLKSDPDASYRLVYRG